MKRNIIFYRHGKSDWSIEYPDDHERPLADKGRSSASLMGRILALSGQTPDLVITSSAVRARQTAEISMKAGGWTSPLKVMSILYGGNAAAIMKMMNTLDDKYRCVLLVGHEPSCSGLTSFLIDGGNLRFPTAGMARIEFKIKSWYDLKPGLGELRWLLQPGFFLKGSFNL